MLVIASHSASPDYGPARGFAESRTVRAAAAWSIAHDLPSCVWAVRSEPSPTWGSRDVTFVALAASAPRPVEMGPTVELYMWVTRDGRTLAPKYAQAAGEVVAA